MDYQLGPGPLQVDQNTTDEKIKGDIGIVENGDIATHAILKDYYVIWKGDLYKAKTDISSGTTLSAETNGNLEPKSNGIGGEVAALNSKLSNKIKMKIVTVTPVESQYAIPFTHTGSIPWDNDININNFISAHTRLTAAMTFSAFNGGIQFFCSNSQTQTVVVCYIGS